MIKASGYEMAVNISSQQTPLEKETSAVDSGWQSLKAPEIYTTTSMQCMSVQGRRRCCEVAVSGVYRQSGYIYTNYDLLVMHAIYCDIIVFKYVIPDTLENIN